MKAARMDDGRRPGQQTHAGALGSSLLASEDPAPGEVTDADADSRFVIVVDHAGRATPRALGRLGLPEAAFDLHIAWDIGAGALALRLGASLGAAVIRQPYSRLVIDCNRAPGQA